MENVLVRQQVTKFRLSAHRLAIETGRYAYTERTEDVNSALTKFLGRRTFSLRMHLIKTL